MQGVDQDRVTDWLLDNIDGAVAPFEFELITGGRSNLTFSVVDANGSRFVLRRPPIGHVLATAHDMAREHRVLTAVGSTTVPVPKTLGLCTDESVNEAPFYVMSFVEGEVLDSPEKAELLAPELRPRASEDLIDTLADLHSVDIDAIGLGDFARRDGYLERQLKRWTTQWDRSRTRELPAVDEVAERLARNVPDQQGVAIVHGDYRFGNCLVDTKSGSVAAVLDWELCTLGDPLADVGHLGVYWVAADGSGRDNDPSSAPGFASYRELVSRYAKRSGYDVAGIDYYVAFSHWRLAVISEGVYRRYLAGAMGADADAATIERYENATIDLVATARAVLDRLGI